MQRMRQQGVSALIALGFMAATVLTAGSAQAASGNGPYYAEPSWSQKLPAATRFVVLTDWNSEAVLDRETGLVWEKTPSITARTWLPSRDICINSAVGNRKGWRLPAIAELASLVDPSPAPGPTLPPGHPFINVQATFYWSATPATDNSAWVWGVYFDSGFVYGVFWNILPTPPIGYVWCVRGGMNTSQY